MIEIKGKKVTLQELEDFLSKTPSKEWRGISIINERINLKDWSNIRDLISFDLERFKLQNSWFERVKRRVLVCMGKSRPVVIFRNNTFSNDEKMWLDPMQKPLLVIMTEEELALLSFSELRELYRKWELWSFQFTEEEKKAFNLITIATAEAEYKESIRREMLIQKMLIK